MRRESHNSYSRFLDRAVINAYAEFMSKLKKKSAKRKALMIGIGLDSDGKKRLTTGENFALVGGAQETHERMTEAAIKINEKLKSKGKQLEDVSHEEFDEMAHEAGLKRVKPNDHS